VGYWPVWVSLTWLTVGLLTVFAAAGCRQAVPSLDAAAPSRATITGTIRGPEGTTAVDGRIVEVIDLSTQRRRRVTTNRAGGFTLSLGPGAYRVELTLREGEAIVRQPGVIHIGGTDAGADADADFVIGTGRISRPRAPSFKVDDGLGSPVA
jgi:hypothetical protein